MSKKRTMLGMTMSGHGFSGALLVDGKVTVATSLERLTRKKYDMLLPITKTDLRTFGWNASPEVYKKALTLPFDTEHDFDNVDFNSLEGFHRILDYLLKAGSIELKDIECVTYSYRYNENVRRFFSRHVPKAEFIVPEHHYSHACQAFFPSPFDEAAILVLDGQGVPLKRYGGDQLSGCLAYGRGNSIEIYKYLPVNISLGGMYDAFTRICGFGTNEEGKLMGLAAYGKPTLYDEVKDEIRYNILRYSRRDLRDFMYLAKRGFLPRRYIYHLGNYKKIIDRFPQHKKGEPYTDDYKNLAFAGQQIIEDVILYLAKWLYKKTGSKNLVIAGGVGLNCVANWKILKNTDFKNIFIHPNAGDNGLPVGQNLFVHTCVDGNDREYVTDHDYLGCYYTSSEIESAIKKYERDDDLLIKAYENMEALYDVMADHIEKGHITSWWQGRSEFGPRALGNRSILADPRGKETKDILNSRVKFRESFRPFTPSVLAEKANEYFDLDIPSPFMLLAPQVKVGKAEVVPAITHADNTARVQTVTREVNERYYGLIKAFEKRTGIPMVLNTSFNIAGEPIVETPEDAIKCFLSTDIDVLGIDKYLLKKKSKGL